MADGSTAAPPSTTDAFTAFLADLAAAWDELTNHQSAGRWAMIALSAILTVVVWFHYGAQAGAPLAASFFICAATIMN